MTAKCVGCGLDWNVSIYQKIPRTGYICPHCESRLRAGETLPNIQASQKARPQRTKGATPLKRSHSRTPPAARPSTMPARAGSCWRMMMAAHSA